MKKLVLISIVAALLLGASAGFAQPTNSPQSAGHDVSVTIPNLLMIRLTLGSDLAAVEDPTSVAFSWDAAGFEPVGTFGPTNLASANWDAVRVFANGTGWSFAVETEATLGFDWSSVTVTPQAVDGVTMASFALPDGGEAELLTAQAPTSGWRDLGFGPAQFSLALDGSEEPETYTTTVTYSIANP